MKFASNIYTKSKNKHKLDKVTKRQGECYSAIITITSIDTSRLHFNQRDTQLAN